jgi:hypothetical protein
MSTNRKPAAGSTIEPRIHTRCLTVDCLQTMKRGHLDEESGPCFDLGGCEVCRNSPPSTLLSTITLIRNAASQVDLISSSTAPPLLPSGVASARNKRQRHCSFGDWFEFVWQHRLLSTIEQGFSTRSQPCQKRGHDLSALLREIVKERGIVLPALLIGSFIIVGKSKS